MSVNRNVRGCLVRSDCNSAGGSAIAELRFREPVYVFVGDRFVLRDASQGITLAGGVVLTTVTDVIGIIAFIGLATYILIGR